MSKFGPTVYEKHIHVYKVRLQKMSQGQRSRGYQRASALDCRVDSCNGTRHKKILSKFYLKSKMESIQT